MTVKITNQWKSEIVINGSDPAANKEEIVISIKGGSPIIVNTYELITAIKAEATVDFDLIIPDPLLSEFKGDLITVKKLRDKEFNSFLIRSSEFGKWMSVTPIDGHYLHSHKDISGWKPAKVIEEG